MKFLLVYQALDPRGGYVTGNLDITTAGPITTYDDVHEMRRLAAEKRGCGPNDVVILNIIPLPIGTP